MTQKGIVLLFPSLRALGYDCTRGAEPCAELTRTGRMVKLVPKEPQHMADPAPKAPNPTGDPAGQVLVPVKNRRGAVTPVFSSWGEALSYWMEQSNVSTRELADRLERGLSVVYQWKGNKERPGPAMLQALQEIFPAMRDAPEPVPAKTHDPKVRTQRMKKRRMRKETVETQAPAAPPAPRTTQTPVFDEVHSLTKQLHDAVLDAVIDLAITHGADQSEVDVTIKVARLKALKQSVLDITRKPNR